MSEIYPEPQKTPHRSRSFFWPVVLVVIGVVFLLQNMGLLQGDTVDTLFALWPVILILIGIDGLLDRSGIAGPALMIGLGVIFLLSNLGYFRLDILQVIFTLWPILLIAWGFDLMVGRRSWAASLAALLVLLAILAGAVGVLIGWIRVGGLDVRTLSVEHTLADAEQARLSFEIPVGRLHLSADSTAGRVIRGSYPTGTGFKMAEDFSIENGVAAYQLTTEDGGGFLPAVGSNLNWDYRLAREIPMEINVDQGAGALTLELADLQVTRLEGDFGAGALRVTLPGGDDLTVSISGGVGFITVVVPENVGVRVRRGTALAFFQAPTDYKRDGDLYLSPGYEDADVKIDLDLNIAVGGVQIRR